MEAAGPVVLVLGPLRVLHSGRVLPLHAKKHRQLLTALVAGGGSPRSTDQLVDALWGTAAPASAPKLLQVYVSKLRKALPSDVHIQTTPTGYLVDVAECATDVAAFERGVAAARHAVSVGNLTHAVAGLRRGLDLWRGAPYADVPDDDLARAEAGRLEALRRSAVEALFDAELMAGRHREVLPELLALAEAEPFNEKVQGLAMLALYRAGRQSEALTGYRSTRGHLTSELGVEPGAELRALHRRILEQDPTLDRQAPPSLGARMLPTAPNPLRGRSQEVRDLLTLLRDDDVRLVVLTGAGGTGKTRLALEVARAIEEEFAQGAVFVDLTVVRDPAHLMRTISGALGVHHEPDSVAAVAQALRGHDLLLLLDNMEHLRAAGADLVRLLNRTTRLRLLVTSRVVLHLSSEHVYPVTPLPAPDAAALFVERARAADAHFTASPDDNLVHALCHRLDDLPLAIELAAAQVRSATVAEMLGRLRSRLPVLTGSPRDLPARQQTLEATLKWSVEQLDERERRALLRLSVFAGGSTAEAAEAVCDAQHEDLASLVDHHLLVRRIAGQQSRYSMLETVREFAGRHLVAAHGGDELRRSHAKYYLGLAESLALSVDAIGGESPQRHDLARQEQENMRAALDWSLTNDAHLGLRLALALEQFWITTAPREGADRIGMLLGRAQPVSDELRARALRDLGGSLQVCGEWERAMEIYVRSLALFEKEGDDRSALSLRHRLGHGDLVRGRFDQARQVTDVQLAIARKRGYRLEESSLLQTLAFIEMSDGKLELAHELHLRCLAILRELGGWPWGESIALGNLADTAAQMRAAERGERFGLEALAIGRDIGDAINVVFALATLAAVARVRPDEERAGWLWGVVEAAEKRTFLGRWHQSRDELAQRVLCDAGAMFEQGRAAGQRVHLEDAVRTILSDAPRQRADETPSRITASGGGGGSHADEHPRG